MKSGPGAVLLLCICPLASAQFPQVIRDVKSTGSAGECCPYWYSGCMWGYNACCSKYGVCPKCDILPPWRQGCYYRGDWYHVGAIMEINAEKCFYVRCWWSQSVWLVPTVYIEHVSSGCGCCEYNGQLYQKGARLHVGVCSWRSCEGGRWEKAPAPLSEKRPCPAGYTTYGEYCLVTIPKLVAWWGAYEYCTWIGGWLFWIEGNERAEEQAAHSVNGTGAVWLQPAREQEAVRPKKDQMCEGIARGAMKRSELLCTTILRPLCLVPKVPCEQRHCKIGGKGYENGQLIQELNKCERIVCQNGYALYVIGKECCYHEQYAGPKVGWISRYYPPGRFSPVPGISCTCYAGSPSWVASCRWEMFTVLDSTKVMVSKGAEARLRFSPPGR